VKLGVFCEIGKKGEFEKKIKGEKGERGKN